MATTKKAETEEVKTEEYSKEWLNEKVPVRLFKDGDKYKGDVFVCVNGRSILIQRGKEVEIPRKFALVLEQSMAQDTKTADMIDAKSSEYASEAKAHGV